MLLIDSWYTEFRAKLQAIACHLGYTVQEAEDIVHQFFLDLLQKDIPGVIQNPEAWLVTAFKRRLIDLHRSQQRKGHYREIESFHLPSAQEIIEKLETDTALINHIAAAYKKLPARFRRVIYMKYYQGHSTEKIVALTGLTHQTVYNNLSKGIQHLRQHLKKDTVLERLVNFMLCLLP
ncbi:RNA polymerase sigma factor [Niabella drilacis]|uniref:RNA polymerase sigma-70 factor, ECF subfamily n=1 Tax=Niabella drilacis (strain DSM 25811 / CCM 8410 / CCUG 62505 / LMG 26954 / E90) TaxID=1285928 RepID=A0A1G6YLX4_NIADE|nr:RNA polymerase sigma factor [Niabella drilacis]SDD90677.1 RNA polymerase sigma-70 factor, ECF subfamily [Niabella drilacis]